MIRGRSGLVKQLRKQTNVAASVSVKAEPFVNGTNANYVEQMYLSWMDDPSSVHASWNAYFKQVEQGAAPGSAFQAPPALASSAVYKIEGGATQQVAAAGGVSSADVSKQVNKYLAV